MKTHCIFVIRHATQPLSQEHTRYILTQVKGRFNELRQPNKIKRMMSIHVYMVTFQIAQTFNCVTDTCGYAFFILNKEVDYLMFSTIPRAIVSPSRRRANRPKARQSLNVSKQIFSRTRISTYAVEPPFNTRGD